MIFCETVLIAVVPSLITGIVSVLGTCIANRHHRKLQKADLAARAWEHNETMRREYHNARYSERLDRYSAFLLAYEHHALAWHQHPEDSLSIIAALESMEHAYAEVLLVAPSSVKACTEELFNAATALPFCGTSAAETGEKYASLLSAMREDLSSLLSSVPGAGCASISASNPGARHIQRKKYRTTMKAKK